MGADSAAQSEVSMITIAIVLGSVVAGVLAGLGGVYWSMSYSDDHIFPF